MDPTQAMAWATGKLPLVVRRVLVSFFVNPHLLAMLLYDSEWWFRRIKNPQMKNNPNEDLHYDLPNLSKPLQTTGYRHTLNYMRAGICAEALHFYTEAADFREAYERSINKLVVAGGDLEENRRLAAECFVKYCKSFKKVYNRRIREQPDINLDDYELGDETPIVETEINLQGVTRQECADVMEEIVKPFLASLRATESPVGSRCRNVAVAVGDSRPTTKKKPTTKKQKNNR